MLTATLLVCLQATGGPAPAQQFDVRLRGAVGEVMAKRLSDVFGTKVTTDASLADVALIFNVKGVTFEQFRGISAEGLDAEWRHENGVWQVYRSKEKQDAEMHALMQRRRAFLTKTVNSRTATPLPTQRALAELAQKVKLAYDDDLHELVFGEEVLTGEGVLFDVWESLGVEAIAAMPLDQRWTYTSDGFGKTRKLEVLAQTAALVNAEYKRVEAEFRRSGAWDRLTSEANGFTPEQFMRYLGVSPVEKMVLEVMTSVEYVELTLSGFDKDGNETVNFYDYMETLDPEDSPSLRLIPEVPFEPSKESLAIRTAVMTMFDDDSQTDKEAVFDLLGGMPETDPLALDVSDILFAASDKAGLQLAGRLSDDLIQEFGLYRLMEYESGEEVTKQPATMRGALSWLDTYLNLNVTPDKRLLVRPELPAQFQTFVARKAMAEYVRNNVGSPVLDIARFPSLFQPPRSFGVESLSEAALIAHSNENMIWVDSPYLIATWQGLNQQMKAQAETPQGATLTVGRAHPSLGYHFEQNALNGGRWSSVSYGIEAVSDDFIEEPSDHVALNDLLLFDIVPGVFDRLQINLRVERKPVVMVTVEGSEESNLVTVEEMAEWFFYNDEDEAAAWLSKCRFGMENGVEIKLSFQTPIGLATEETTVVMSASGRTDMTFQQMPADWQQAFRREVERLKKDGG
ncbi:MAG: hypothetical protein WD716_07675 [Fimbriimonadaceae bacterium]